MLVRELLNRLTFAETHLPAAGPPAAAPVAELLAAVPSLAAPPPVPPAALWPAERIAVTDALWGEGFLQPGGAEEVLRLAKPLGLSAAQSLLLTGAGTGGPPRVLAAGLGCWVSAFETDAGLAKLAASRCAAAGLGKRAEVAPWSPAEPGFPERYFHRALVLDPLAEGRADVVLPSLAKALKPGGELVMTAVLAGPAMTDAMLQGWRAAERRPHAPPAEAELGRLLVSLGHDVRVAKDITDAHLQMTLQHWHDFVVGLGTQKPTPARARLIVREAEIWLLRARLMRAGAIRMMRFHSMARSG